MARIGKKLNEVHAKKSTTHTVNAFYNGMALCAGDNLSPKQFSELNELLDVCLVKYDEGTALHPEAIQSYFDQLDQIQRDALAGKEIAVPWVFLAVCNIHWLEQRGHLRTDNQNGLQFITSREEVTP